MTAPIPERHPDRSTRTEEAMSETERAEAAEARARYLDEEALRLQRTIDEARQQRDDWHDEATRQRARAEKAEAELKKLESLHEDTCEETDKARDERDALEEALARARKQNADLIAAWKQGNTRRTDTTPHAALECLAREQGVQPVRSIDQLTAPEGERVSDEEWTAYADALGIELGDEQGDGRDHTFEMLDDDAPKQNPRTVAEYWHEWADTCSNGGRDDEWTTVAQVVGRILAAMDGEQDEQGVREGGA